MTGKTGTIGGECRVCRTRYGDGGEEWNGQWCRKQQRGLAGTDRSVAVYSWHESGSREGRVEWIRWSGILCRLTGICCRESLMRSESRDVP